MDASKKTCPVCHGNHVLYEDQADAEGNHIDYEVPCPVCRGTGVVDVPTATVPASPPRD